MKRLFGLLAVCAIVAGACGSSTATPTGGSQASQIVTVPTAGSSESATGTTTITSKDTMIIAIPGTPPGIDPDNGNSPQMYTIGAQIYGEQGLRWAHAPYTVTQTVADPNKVPGFWVANTDGTTLQPGIIQLCTLASDGSKVTMVLRQGVKSAYGNEFTTADITWGLQRSVASGNIGAFFMGVGGAGDVNQWHAVDAYTEEIDQENGQSMANLCPLLAHLGAEPSWIMDSTEAKKHATDSDPWATDWINHYGSWFGPYYITDWEADKSVTLQVNPNYYLPQPPIKKIIYQVVPQSADRIALLEAGKVDLIEDISPTEAQALDGQPGVRPVAVESDEEFWAVLDNSKPPFDNVQVRQAINFAIDRETIARDIYHGLAYPFQGILPVTYPGFTEFHLYDFNLTRAKELLTQAGYGSGLSLDLSYSSADPVAGQVAVEMQTTLSQIGVTLNLKALPAAAIADLVNGGKAQFALWSAAPFLPDPVFSTQLWYEDVGVGGAKNQADSENFVNPSIDQEIQKCGNITDWTQRVQCVEQLDQTIAALAPIANIAAPYFLYAVTDKVSNANFNYGLSYVVEGMTITP